MYKQHRLSRIHASSAPARLGVDAVVTPGMGVLNAGGGALGDGVAGAAATGGTSSYTDTGHKAL